MAWRDPHNVIGALAVPDREAVKFPVYTPGASTIVSPGPALARALCSPLADDTVLAVAGQLAAPGAGVAGRGTARGVVPGAASDGAGAATAVAVGPGDGGPPLPQPARVRPRRLVAAAAASWPRERRGLRISRPPSARTGSGGIRRGQRGRRVAATRCRRSRAGPPRDDTRRRHDRLRPGDLGLAWPDDRGLRADPGCGRVTATRDGGAAGWGRVCSGGRERPPAAAGSGPPGTAPRPAAAAPRRAVAG